MPSLPKLRPSPARQDGTIWHRTPTSQIGDPSAHHSSFGHKKCTVSGARAKVISEIVQNVEKFTQSSQLKKANLDEFLSFFVKPFCQQLVDLG